MGGGVSPRAPSPLTPAGGPGKDYEKAVEYYSRAIELNPGNAIYYGNRSLAYLRTECYGYALADATRAVELDKKYVKGYYRRAASNMALGKFKAALRDYETVRLEGGGSVALFCLFYPFFQRLGDPCPVSERP